MDAGHETMAQRFRGGDVAACRGPRGDAAFALGLLGISWELKLGDTISAKATPLEARPSKTPARGILKIGFEVINQNDEVVQVGSIVLLMRRRPDPAS